MIKYIWTLWHDPDFKSSVFQSNGQIFLFGLIPFPSHIHSTLTAIEKFEYIHTHREKTNTHARKINHITSSVIHALSDVNTEENLSKRKKNNNNTEKTLHKQHRVRIKSKI